MVTFAEEMLAVAQELLTEFGMAVTVSRENVTGYDTNTLAPTTTPVNIAGYAAPFDPSNSNITGYEKNLVADSVATHKWFYLSAAAEVKTGDEIVTPTSKRYKIVALTEIGVAETTVYCRVATTKV